MSGDSQSMMMVDWVDRDIVAKRGGGRIKKHAVWKYFECLPGTSNEHRCLVPGGCTARGPVVKGRANHLMVHLQIHHKKEFYEISSIEKERKERENSQNNFMPSSSSPATNVNDQQLSQSPPQSDQPDPQNIFSEEDDIFAL